jgi:MFS transporter, MHS family, proline/betaine transporter
MDDLALKTAPSRVRQSSSRTTLAGLIGNVLEWFDFAVYGYFAGEIGGQFFPQSSPAAQQLLVFTVFAVGFGARPIGSLVLGAIGDRVGRRALLVFSIALMGGATLLMGLLPTYDVIGPAAPILLVTLRMIQGFSVGGEFTGSMVYATELAGRSTRGLIAGAAASGTTIGFMLGSASSWLIHSLLSPEDVAAWGWRVPFIGSAAFVLIGWFLRRGLQETPAGEQAVAQRAPLFRSLLADWLPIVQTFGIAAMTNAAYYLVFTYTVERRSSDPDAGSAFLLANTISLGVVLLAKPLGGWLSDRIGRRRLMLTLTILAMLLMLPALQLMLYGEPGAFALGQMLLAIPIGMSLGLQGAMLVEIFPLRTRVTSLSFAYGITIALAGGTAPLVSAWLAERFAEPLTPGWYLLVYGLFAIAVLIPMRETNTRALAAPA